MMAATLIQFDQSNLGLELDQLTETELDALDFGVIGFDSDTAVFLYNKWECSHAGLSRERVIGHHVFTMVAPCMNNFLVAQRFQDAAAANAGLDATIDYVLTLRMRPTKVKLRLIAGPTLKASYVLVYRPT